MHRGPGWNNNEVQSIDEAIVEEYGAKEVYGEWNLATEFSLMFPSFP